LVADTHGEQSSYAQEKQARKQILNSYGFVVFRPDILPKEAKLLALLMMSSLNGSVSDCLSAMTALAGSIHLGAGAFTDAHNQTMSTLSNKRTPGREFQSQAVAIRVADTQKSHQQFAPSSAMHEFQTSPKLKETKL
jgi:hypothetical protein